MKPRKRIFPFFLHNPPKTVKKKIDYLCAMGTLIGIIFIALAFGYAIFGNGSPPKDNSKRSGKTYRGGPPPVR